MSETIIGMQIDVPGTELREHLEERADHHRIKAEQYAKQATDVADLQPASGQTNDPVAQLQQSQRDHDRRAKLFRFMARHVREDATYRLSDRDLTFVEIIVDRYA